ncbi:hypothetical protein LO762_16290 [Actinocorallia sp. API 0066]|uniref:hypothetical protein n=1 Tax=Actinocorallia sp. API 0066 TaxID=2896846 RepID=UPI001E5D71C7|nr:hypothetical protein [Actinocorallia sp. API 0066]MCD0450737.1 hypothetical protein [Actinocorallia sp. API 0066]
MASDERDGNGGAAGRDEPRRGGPPEGREEPGGHGAGETGPTDELGIAETGPRAKDARESGAFGTERRRPGEPPGAAVDSGATGTERGRKDFNPAWLLVPAAGLMLGGLGVANLTREPEVRTTPTVTVTAADRTVTVPAAPAASPSPGACRLVFTDTRFERTVGTIRDSRTGASLSAPDGRTFAVVNTAVRNEGGSPCSATAGFQRGYTDSATFFPGKRKVGQLLEGGRALETAIGPGQAVQGTYVFQIPSRSTLREVRLRQNGGSEWTTVRAR